MRVKTMVVFTVIVALVLTACGGQAAKGPLKIAALLPLSGPVAAFGASAQNGVQTAIDEFNEAGGVLGRQIELIVEDSQCSAEPAVSAANKVIDQDGARFIVGEICSSASIPLSEVANSKGVVQITPGSTNPQVTVDDAGNVKRFIFRACFIDPFQGKVGARFALDDLGAKTAAVFLDQGNDYTRGLAEFFRDEFEAGGGKVVVWETYTADDQDFSAILTKVKDANPDVLYLPDYYSTINLQAAQAREMGITATFLGGDGWGAGELDPAVDGGYHTDHYSSEDPRAIVQDWVQSYNSAYGEDPNSLSTLAYDATKILLEGIKEAGTDDPAKVADTIAGMTFDVVSGQISYDASHNPVKSVTIVQIEGGAPTFVTVVNP
jgi:branched-chain amino acid transport system substrate-binding protein